ncbi:MliC family protein [Microbulbifer mangrovi]|uniref:MliC family protein n=1 Tax=Microbulbifer mangrovi TaxID=927787 RepID=UPI0009905472|nr:MliC family protein [Microbulbifer mangrovi]
MLNLRRSILFSLVFAVSATGCSKSDSTPPQASEPQSSGSGASEQPRPVTAGSENESSPGEVKPTYDCNQQLSSSIEELICADSGLAQLDQQMAEVFAAAAKTDKAQQDRYFKARQRGWIKGRNDCWKAQDRRACTENSYKRQIASLQARYALVPGRGPVTYICDGSEVTATYYPTEPPSAVAEHKGEESLMFIEPTASGTRYRGRNEIIWEHQGEAKITWGVDGIEMQCKVRSW